MSVDSTEVFFSVAEVGDLPAIVTLLADDHLGEARELLSLEPDPAYVAAFDEILADPNNELIVGRLQKKVVAVLQMTYIPNLTLRGTKRAQIEGVRVSSAYRGQKIGHRLFAFALARARSRGCQLAQLTTNQSRTDASHFYHALGFKASHVGFKLSL